MVGSVFSALPGSRHVEAIAVTGQEVNPIGRILAVYMVMTALTRESVGHSDPASLHVC